MANICWRDDDISWDSDLERLQAVQEIFERHGQREVYSIVPFGRAVYDADNYSHDMPLDQLENIIGNQPLDSNPQIVKFLQDSIKKGHSISLHGWTHTRTTDYRDKIEPNIEAAIDYLEKTLGTKPLYFVPPFNHYNQHVVTACQNLHLPCSIGGGQLEKCVEMNIYPLHPMYWFHYWRFKDLKRLDQWLTHFLTIEK